MGEVCAVIEGSSQQHTETSEQAGFSENQQIEEDLGEVGLLTADASKEWREGVIASARLDQFWWRTIVARSLETFQEEEEKRAATEAKFAAQFENDFECATHQSESEGKRDKMEQAAESSCAATQLAVFRMQADRRKVKSDELAERREAAKKEEEKNEKQRQLVIAYRKAGDRVRAEVMRLIEVKRTQAEKDSRKGKGTKFIRWETDLSTRALKIVTMEELLSRARDAGVNEEELQMALQTCEGGTSRECIRMPVANSEANGW